jgi:hypothetical protein
VQVRMERDLPDNQFLLKYIGFSDGISFCGLYLTLGLVLEKMKLEQVIDIDLAVRMVRLKNPKFIPTFVSPFILKLITNLFI